MTEAYSHYDTTIEAMTAKGRAHRIVKEALETGGGSLHLRDLLSEVRLELTPSEIRAGLDQGFNSGDIDLGGDAFTLSLQPAE